MSDLRITKKTADMEVSMSITPEELQNYIKELDPLTLVQVCHMVIECLNGEIIAELQGFFGEPFQYSLFVEEVEDFYQRVTNKKEKL